LQEASQAAVGLVKFYTKEDLRRYLKSLVEHYEAHASTYGDQLGSLLRVIEQEKGNQKPGEPGKTVAKGWARMGPVAVNSGDPKTAMAEVLFHVHEDVKARLAKATEAAKAFDELSNTLIPDAGSYFLQLRNGVPERIVADTLEKKRDPFRYTAEFQLV
jgi:hypothetical protein